MAQSLGMRQSGPCAALVKRGLLRWNRTSLSGLTYATLLTLSFHAPFDVPENTIEPVEPTHPHAAQLDCIRYTDWAIGRFMEKARQSEYFKDTIFVFAADHMGGYREEPNTPASYRYRSWCMRPASSRHSEWGRCAAKWTSRRRSCGYWAGSMSTGSSAPAC